MILKVTYTKLGSENTKKYKFIFRRKEVAVMINLVFSSDFINLSSYRFTDLLVVSEIALLTSDNLLCVADEVF